MVCDDSDSMVRVWMVIGVGDGVGLADPDGDGVGLGDADGVGLAAGEADDAGTGEVVGGTEGLAVADG